MLKRTPLYEAHVSLGARMVDFVGWEMPVQYAGPIPEHMAVREAAGLFDVSHMGEIEVTGAGALALVQRLTTNDVSKLDDNQVQYTMLTNEGAGVIDDLLVYRLNGEHFLLVVNASNTEKVFEWIKGHADPSDTEVHNLSMGYALLALQGPRAERILQDLSDHMLDRIPYYWSQRVMVDGVACRVSRTGYTGEDGFEIFCDPKDARHIWNRLLVTGHDRGLVPCGLAARNTTRLEAAFRLHGNDIDETTRRSKRGSAGRSSWRKATSSGARRSNGKRPEGCAASSWDSRCWTAPPSATATLFTSMALRWARSRRAAPRLI
jgi:aminomethyltransferase